MKSILTLTPILLFLLVSVQVIGQGNVGINTTGANPDASAMLDVKSTDKGILIPRMNTAERNAIALPASGLLVYDTDLSSFMYYNGTIWEDISVNAKVIIDGDKDTKVSVEKITDDDIIRMEVAGKEYFKLGENAHDQPMFELFPNNAYNNLFIGKNSGLNTNPIGSFFDGRWNTFIGLDAGRENITGHSNTFVGNNSGEINIASENTFLGAHSGTFNTTGDRNTILGNASGYENSTGNNNVLIGYESGYYSTAGSNNTIIGSGAGKGSMIHSKTGNVLIGFNAGSLDTTDNKLYIENSASTTPLIYGDFSSNLVKIYSKLNINDKYTFPSTSGGLNQILKYDGSGNLGWDFDHVNDADADPLNEIQTLSKTGSTISLSNGGGSIIDEKGPFEKVSNTVSLITTADNLILGRDDMPLNGEIITDNFMAFDNSKSALRGGRLFSSANWSPDSIGSYSLAYGYNPKATGSVSTALGGYTISSGYYSLATGYYTTTPSAYETAFGRYNTEYTPISSTGWNPNDRLFVIGNGTSSSNRKDLVSIMKNGDIQFNGLLTLSNGMDEYTLPNTDGAINQVLKTDGVGNITWSTDAVSDADSDPSNELQNLSISGQDLSISSGNTVDLSGLDGLWDSGTGTNIYHTGKVGIGTSSAPTAQLLVRQLTSDDGIKVEHNYSGSGSKYGINVNLPSTGSGAKSGIFSQVQAGSSTSSSGINTYVIAGSSGTHSGVNASISGAGTAIVGTAFDASGVAAKMNGPSHLIGNVAIGTEDEIGALHVHEINSTDAKMYVTPNSPGNNGTSSIFLAENPDASLGMEWKFNGVTNQLELLGKVNATIYGPHLYIDRASGNMALGSSNFANGYKLSVDGKMACEEVLVELSSGWPDYVFQEDYNLKSIEELDAYIKKEKHLPGIAPASEMESNGLNLGEMQRLLTEKVEELSLYIIQLNEDNKVLRNRISQLESEKK